MRRKRLDPGLRADLDSGAELQRSIAAYELLMDAIVPESQYYQGRRENGDKVAFLGSIIERAAARERERERSA